MSKLRSKRFRQPNHIQQLNVLKIIIVLLIVLAISTLSGCHEEQNMSSKHGVDKSAIVNTFIEVNDIVG